MLKKTFRVVAALPIVTLSWAAPASAQDSGGLSGLLLRFFSEQNPVVLQQAPEPFNHSAHFVSQPEARATLQQLNRVIATQISTFPLTSSSAGFTFEFDPTIGVFERNTETFGPIFAERALTAGRGRFSMGVTALEAEYNKFEGQDLRENDMQLYLTHIDVNGDGTPTAVWFEGDLIRADLSIDLRNRTTVVVANYGVTDTFDIGVAVPFVELDMTASILTSVERIATGPDPFVVHAFAGDADSQLFPETGSASGVGDIVVRGKWNFAKSDSLNLAAALDVRLPTGDEDDLLGSGATQGKLFFIASKDRGRFTPRLSAGYTVSTEGSGVIGDLPNELSYSAGFDAALHSRVSFTADFVGRTLIDADRVVEEERSFQHTFRTDPTVRTETRLTPVVETGNLNVAYLSAGVKINPVGQLLLVGSVLVALNDNGLQDTVTPVVGLDYTF